MSGEVGNIALFLEIPNFDLCVSSSGSEDETIRMKLKKYSCLLGSATHEHSFPCTCAQVRETGAVVSVPRVISLPVAMSLKVQCWSVLVVST